jgi:hypothetical protein
MADIAWADVTGAFPADVVLAAVPLPLQGVILDRVNKELSATFFGGVDSAKFKLARLSFAAHMGIVLSPGNAAAGPVISEGIDDLSRAYAVTVKGSHASTGYGQAFDALVASSPYRIGIGT